MRSMTATRTSTDSAETAARGCRASALLGIMQSLYDDMLPGITERQAGYAADVAAALADVADVVVGRAGQGPRGRRARDARARRRRASTACSS